MTPQIGKNGLLNGQKVPFWRAIVSALCYFIFYFAVQLATEVVYVIYLHLTLPLDGLSKEAYDKMIEDAYFRDGNYLMITIDVVLFLLLAIVFLARGKTFAEGMGMKKTKISSVPLAFVAGLGLTSALFFVMIVVESLFPAIMEDYGNTMDASYNMEQLIAFIFAGVIGAPLIEELIFRHLVTGRLSRGLPRIVAILIGSALFGIIHGHWIQWIYAGVLGFVMACLYFAYDSIWVTIAMHAGFNSLSVISYVQSMMKTEA
jgi:membrane protease YdiL (CAAX protease family)